MFNAAFLSSPVESLTALEERLRTAQAHFQAQALRWSFWICEDWLATGVRRKLSRTCEALALRLSSEMPGMAADRLRLPARKCPSLDVRRVQSEQTLDDFRALGAVCFHVPMSWFAEVFDPEVAARQSFICWVGYVDGLPVATAATVSSTGAVGLYNVATAPEHRHHGYGEAITRHALGEAIRDRESTPIVLQSTSQGLRLYEQLGFHHVTRVLVYNSMP
jgi:GNAT superfamily N-acetyltransferase